MIYRGHIAYFHYARYHRDKNPLALILYADNKLVHCINLNYLSSSMNDEMVDIIVAIAMRQIQNSSDAYMLYHNYLKRRIPTIILRAYRTYKPQHIKNIMYVSDGFNSSISFVKSMVAKLPKETILKTKIAKEIAGVGTYTPEELSKLKSTSTNQLLAKTQDYFNRIKQVIKPKIDEKKYTKLL